MDRQTLNTRAGAVAGIFSIVASVLIILGLLAIIAGFIQAVAEADEVFVGIMAGLLVAFAIGVYVVLAWASVQLFALVAGYIEMRSGEHG